MADQHHMRTTLPHGPVRVAVVVDADPNLIGRVEPLHGQTLIRKRGALVIVEGGTPDQRADAAVDAALDGDLVARAMARGVR